MDSKDIEKSKVENHDQIEPQQIQSPPDGGWGWMIVFGGGIALSLAMGFNKSVALVYQALLEKFQQSAAATAWVTSLTGMIRFMSSPIVSSMCNRFGHRQVAIAAGIITSISYVLSAFPPNLPYLYVTLGLMQGIGVNMFIVPSLSMVAIYFDKNKGKAMSIITSSFGFGALYMAPILRILFDQYGYSGTLLILGGLILHFCAAGLLFRPLKLTTSVTLGSTNSLSKVGPSDSQSLAQNSTKGSLQKLEREHTNELSLDPFSKTLAGSFLTGSLTNVRNEKLSSLGSTHSVIKEKHYGSQPSIQRHPKGPVERFMKQNAGQQDPLAPKNQDLSDSFLTGSLTNIRNLSGSTSGSTYSMTKVKPFGSQPSIQNSIKGPLILKREDTEQLRHLIPNDPNCSDDSQTDRREEENNTMSTNSKSKSTGCCSSILRKILNVLKAISDEIGLNMLADSEFFLVGCVMSSIAWTMTNSWTLAAGLAKEKNFTDSEVTLLLVVIAASELPCRIISGFLFDLRLFKQHRVLGFAMFAFVVGIANASLPLVPGTIPTFIVWSFMMGFLGSCNSQYPTVASDLVLRSQITSALGLMRLMQGAGALLGPVVGGLFRDKTGTYAYGFYAGGIQLIIFSILLAIRTQCSSMFKCRKNRELPSDSV